MEESKKSTKEQLHFRNKHKESYDFIKLQKVCPDLSQFVNTNEYGNLTIDFFDPLAVKTLNQALLRQFYNLDFWDIPDGYLCPPVPGRADYIHHIASHIYGEIPYKKMKSLGKKIRCLDIGTGANCIYPIIGNSEYNWSFVGTDIDVSSIDSAQTILNINPNITDKVELRLQNNSKNIFEGIIEEGDFFDLSICNPPFHSSAEEALKGSKRKLSNLKGKKVKKVKLNFGGQSNELWCEGGEDQFIEQMIIESEMYSNTCMWFSTLVSKEERLPKIQQLLEDHNATDIHILPMAQGNKKSRIVTWSFFDQKQRVKLMKLRWL
jgi:23S rRNA (adenine1618-N6)-methyltransferase